MKRLFKPFTKLESGKPHNPNGVGLGLSICKSILVKIGCEIAVVSSKEKTENSKQHGTKIAFSMPVFKESKRNTTIITSTEDVEVSLDQQVSELFFPKSTQESSGGSPVNNSNES